MIALHAAVILSGYLFFFVAVVTGVAFLIEEGRIKAKDPFVFHSFALPLELLDRMNLIAVVVGFILFSLGMVPGLLLARKTWGAFWTGDPKEVWSFLTLGAYTAVLILRLTVGLKGRRVVFLSVMSFLLVIFTFAGVNFLIGSRHAFF